MDLKREFLNDKDVIFYPYRTAQVRDIFCTLEAEDEFSEMLIDEFVDEAAKKAGRVVDNHICFSVGGVHFMYSDRKLYIGTELVERYW